MRRPTTEGSVARRGGFTLLEVMASTAILVIVSGMLFMLANGLQASAVVQETKITTQDEARNAMEVIGRELRQASLGSISSALPGAAITYRIADDLDGNGTAVDVGGNLELTPARTLRRDTEDANGDGVAADQLVLVDAAGNVRVVTNGLPTNEDANASGALDASEDVNQNGILDRGLWFERVGRGIRVTVQAQRRAGAHGPLMLSTLTEIVVPRN